MVIYDLPASQAQALHQRAADIRPQVIVRLVVKHRTGTDANGLPIYDNTFDIVEFDATSRLIDYPNLSVRKPRTPDSRPQEATTVSLKFANPDGYFAATQDGSIIRPSDIHEGSIRIYANVQGATPVIPWFYGRIDKIPTERRGITEITAISTLWEILRKPVQYEDWGTINGQSQQIIALDYIATQWVTISCLGKPLRFLHGVATFDGLGTARPWARKEGGGDIVLRSVGLTGTQKLGIYRVEFQDSENYTVSIPSGQQFTTGNRNVDQTFAGITFKATNWAGTAERGSAIEFRVSLTIQGNPVAIAYYLAERALLNNYGTLPGITPSVTINQASFQQAANRFDGMPIWFSVTNESNEVFSRKQNAKPINAGQIAQQVLDHVACTLVCDLDGLISCKMPFIDDRPLWKATDNEHLTESITIRPADDTYNYLRVQFGYNRADKTYMAELIGDYRQSSAQDIVELTVSMPFTPVGEGNRHAQWLRDTIRRRFLLEQYNIETTVTPQFGLTLLPSDQIRIISNNPALNHPCEVVDIQKPLGKSAKLTLSAIQQPEGTPAQICLAESGNTALF